MRLICNGSHEGDVLRCVVGYAKLTRRLFIDYRSDNRRL